METIYANLMKSYERTGKIGRVRPYDWNHARKVAHAVALSIFNRERRCA